MSKIIAEVEYLNGEIKDLTIKNVDSEQQFIDTVRSKVITKENSKYISVPYTPPNSFKIIFNEIGNLIASIPMSKYIKSERLEYKEKSFRSSAVFILFDRDTSLEDFNTIFNIYNHRYFESLRMRNKGSIETEYYDFIETVETDDDIYRAKKLFDITGRRTATEIIIEVRKYELLDFIFNQKRIPYEWEIKALLELPEEYFNKYYSKFRFDEQSLELIRLMAFKSGTLSSVKKLIDNTPKDCIIDGESVLIKAIESNPDDELIYYLMENKFMGGTSKNAYTPLEIAIKQKDTLIIQKLIEHGYKINEGKDNIYYRVAINEDKNLASYLKVHVPSWENLKDAFAHCIEKDISSCKEIYNVLGPKDKYKALIEFGHSKVFLKNIRKIN